MHFVFSLVLMATAMSISMSPSGTYEDGTVANILFSFTEILYFPVVSLELFPSSFEYLPVFVNSLIWAVVIYIVWVTFSKRLKRA